jgi:hypothetical protein
VTTNRCQIKYCPCILPKDREMMDDPEVDLSTSEYCSGLVKPNPRNGRRKHLRNLKLDFQSLFISNYSMHNVRSG